ncbi:hypothetical protein DYB37_001021 [Aphanomyces astaci]|uniref:Uncharacterized protein n=3 Tax=Aphanomyces astaci TaxID=112090 RepID=A0A3R7EA58_APHAT|nr:hypothetical protein DYB35_001092 [Aphanomyces astaci]RHZ23044.1 hypothetical protein DYB37_001021 [Aphanomyces astaci]
MSSAVAPLPLPPPVISGPVYSIITPKPKWMAQIKKSIYLAISAVGVFLVAYDVFANNWALNDYIGNAMHCRTPVMDMASFSDIHDHYVFSTRDNWGTISPIPRQLLATHIDQLIIADETVYFLAAGMHEVGPATPDLCRDLERSYPITFPTNSTETVVRLAVAMDFVTYIRGDALSHVFGSTATDPVPGPDALREELLERGYEAGVFTADLRMTLEVPVSSLNPGTTMQHNTLVYRIFAKTFNTGGTPMAELGVDNCNMTYVWNATTNMVDVVSSRVMLGEVHILAIIVDRSSTTVAAFYIKVFALLMVLGGYSASAKTVIWVDTDKQILWPWFKRLYQKFAPDLYRHPSHALTMQYICYNSDLFVLLYVVTVLLDENIAMKFTREMNEWNQWNPDFWVSVQIYSMSFRWLWINCCFVKMLKLLCHNVSIVQYNGHNWLVGFFNFSSVVPIYLSSIALMARHQFINYSNSVRHDLSSHVQSLDGTDLDLFASWYVRCFQPMALVIFINLVAILTLDRIVNYKWWSRIAQNSLGRQYMFNSTSILCGIDDVQDKPDGVGGQMIMLPARKLCTLRWFLSSHLLCFGLPEDPKCVRVWASTVLQTKSAVSKGSTSTNGSPTKAPLKDAKATTTEDSARNMLLIGQDQDGYVHLMDENKRDVKALAIEVKILRDSMFYIT